jgi:Flp pilus assembly protein TadD
MEAFMRSKVQGLLIAVLLGLPPGLALADQKAPPPPPPRPVETTAQQDFDRGVKAMQAKDYPGAEALFLKTAVKDPRYASTVRFNLGKIAEERGDFAGAEQQYRAALEADPDSIPAALNLGHVYRLRDAPQKGVEVYQKILEKHPYDTQLLNNLAVCYRVAKDYPKAIDTIHRLLSRSPKNADAYKNLMLIYYDMGNYRMAEFISGNAKKLDDKDPGIYNNLGMIYLKLDDRRAALYQFEKAIEKDPAYGPAHANIGAMALSYRDYKTAEKSYALAIASNPNDWAWHLGSAWALEGEKKPKEAATEFDRVLALRPDQPDAVFGLALSYKTTKDLAKSKSMLEKYLALADAPKKADAQKLLEQVNHTLANPPPPPAPKQADKPAPPVAQGGSAPSLEETMQKASGAPDPGGQKADPATPDAKPGPPVAKAPDAAPAPAKSDGTKKPADSSTKAAAAGQASPQ